MWEYFTNVRPRRKRLDGEQGNVEYKEEFEKAFNLLFSECTSQDINEIKTLIASSDSGVYNIEFDTKGDSDEIDKTSTYHVKFTKSRFLSNPRFKKSLIDFYNPKGIYIKGPREVRKSKNDDKKWIIEYTIKT